VRRDTRAAYPAIRFRPYFKIKDIEWVEILTCNVSVVSSNPFKGSRCFLEKRFTLIAEYWLVLGRDLRVIFISYYCLFYNLTNII